MKINNRNIGLEFPPYIIAEMSANHNGKIENAFKIIEMAKRAGADAVKLQSYTPDTITIQSDRDEFKIKEGLWKDQTLYDLYASAFMPWEWHQALFEKAKEVGITIFSSPFDFTSVDLLETLGAPAYKIASFEAIDLPLIEYVAKTKKPMIISTGMANEIEIQEAIDTAKRAGCVELTILHCVSGYPAPSKDYNLKTIQDMRQKFGCEVGLSDHTLDNTSAIVSIAMGATVIEKHVTLDRNGGGADDSFSLEEDELKALCDNTKIAWEALGSVGYSLKDSEKGNLQFRRSLYIVKDIEEGDEFTHDNVRSIRPGIGLEPKELFNILGKKANQTLKRGIPMSLKYLGDQRI